VADARTCARCGRPNPHEARFCMQCGSRLLPESTERDPRVYTPPHLAERILRSRAALEGERKPVTVGFIDVLGSLALAEELDAEEWHRTLDQFFEILARGIHRYEGTINQYTGDGVMALFGAPLAHEDHALRACHAALHLRERLRRWAEELRRERGIDFHFRIGLNSGEVVVGRIGDNLRMDYTAQGSTVGLAARLQQIAEPDAAFVGTSTARLVAGFFELEDLGEFRLRGISQPERVFALRGRGRARSRLDLARARGLSRFLGREKEMLRLESALEAARENGGRAIAVYGEPGVGKSRLAFEFLERARGRGVRVYEGHGVAHGSPVPFLPVRELWRDAFEIESGDDDRRVRQKIAGALALADRDLAADLPLLFDFMGVPDPEARAPVLEGSGREQRLFRVLARVAARTVREEPSVVFLEDLHFFDAASLRFVEGALPTRARTRTLWLLNYRTGFHAPWLDHDALERIALAPLDPAAADALLAEALGPDPALRELAGRIRARAGGNPLFLEEVVRALAERGALLGSPGAYRLARRVEEIEVPDSIRALLASRIDHLGEPEKELLQTAAVIGRRFATQVLREVSGLPRDRFERALGALERAELVVPDGEASEGAFAFAHPLAQEVAYRAQLRERRRSLHGAVASALSRGEETQDPARAALVAHHFEQAGNRMAAARFLHRAARELSPTEPREALALWRRLRALLAHAPASPELALLGAAAARWLLFLGSTQGMPRAEADAIHEEGRRAAERVRDRRALALVLANYGLYRAQVAVEPDAHLALAEQALAIARQDGKEPLERAMRARVALAHAFAGRFEVAHRLAIELISLPEPALEPLDRATLYWVAGDAAAELGHEEEALEILARGVAFADGVDLRASLAACHVAATRLAFVTEQAARAERHALAAQVAAERSGDRALLVNAQDALCIAHQLSGDSAAAVEAGERALAMGAETGAARIFEDAHRAHLAQAYLEGGRLEDARRMAESAVAAAAARGLRYVPRAELVRTRVLLRAGEPADLEAARRAIGSAQAAAGRSGAGLYARPLRELERALSGRAGALRRS
jgi:class 3 adenylate cyclase